MTSVEEANNESFDPMKANSNSEDVKFDLEPRKNILTLSPSTSINEQNGDLGDAPKEISIQAQPSKDWELDVRGMVSTKKWLQTYGLKKNRMDLHNILPHIGFKHADEYDANLKKPICSRYGNGVFPKHSRSDGKTYNISSNRDKLQLLVTRLEQAIALYKRRLDWLTSESRRIFGVIEEKSICVVLDIINMSPQLFRQYRTAMERVIQEQISQISKFNLIRSTEDLTKYQKESTAVTSDSIAAAIEWLWKLDRTAAVSPMATCEALVQAISDPNMEAVYLFTEGSSCDGCHELLKEKLTGSRMPVHVVSYNCDKADTVNFLKDLTKITGGRFHAYAVTMEMDSYESEPLNESTNQANIILKKKTFGGVPPGAGVRDDVIGLFEEIEEARTTMGHVQGLLDKLPEHHCSPEGTNISRKQFTERSETYMSSREWLAKYGLKAKKLGFYDVLAGAAFKHRDGVVDVKHPPGEEYQTDAINHKKLVNAKYCDLFPCVRWKNGEVVHVQVTPELHRTYSQRMKLSLTAIQQRVDWLQQGSRELFGTVIEDKIYILIDTSASMKPHLQFVKDKLFILMQEQLRHKQQFNLVAFDSRVSAWRDRLIDVNEKSLRQAWQWIRGLMVSNGSTNTMAALRAALSDHQAEAIYLLTDGRPDQPPKSVLAQVQLQPQVPIHTISFNCSDREANEFLCQLAKDTQGRYHYYSETGIDVEGPEPWESEDIRLLRLELETGYRNLEKITLLRDECSAMAWKKDGGSRKSHSNGNNSHLSLTSPRSNFTDDFRPHSAPGFRIAPTPPLNNSRPSTATGIMMSSRGRPQSAASHRVLGSRARPKSSAGQLASKPLVASHTRTSLLRSINNSGQFSQPDWLLPETRELFDNQFQRQQKIQNEASYTKKSRKKRLSLSDSSKKWLSYHGLAAKKLTLLDALSPTFIPHEPKYVPILNKQVLSRVFDDLLPIAHASGQRKKIRIVNPQGVDLKKYQSKVETLIESCKRRLDRIVWNALPQTEKENFEDNGGVVSFENNREELMEALDRCGWPLKERNITLLENEIKQAQLYIKQADDLMDMSNISDRDSIASSRSSEVSKSRSNLDKHSIRSNSPTSDISIKGKTTQQTKKIKSRKKPSNNTSQPTSTSSNALGVHKGQKIIARNVEDGFYYPGTVFKVIDARHAVIKFTQLGKQKVSRRFIIPTSGAISRPTLRVGDYTLCRVVNQETDLLCYVPGVVQMVPALKGTAFKFYTVALFTGHREHFVNQYLIKINKIRYSFLIRYISEIEQRRPSSSHSSSASTLTSVSSRPRNPTPSKGRKTVRIREKKHERQSRHKKHRTSVSFSTNSSRSTSTSSSENSSRSASRTSMSSKTRSSRSRSLSNSSQNSVIESSEITSQSSSKLSSTASKSGDKKRLNKWRKHLHRQQKKQEHMQKKLRRQADKLNRLQKQLSKKGVNKTEDHKKLLENILGQLESLATPRKLASDKEGRTHAWVQNQNSSDSNKKEGVVIANGDKGILISQESVEGIPDVIVQLRSREIPAIGEEILARWSDEGWYYTGSIKEHLGDKSFIVEDSSGDLERIWREDIIRDEDDVDCTIQPGDAVIALHPTYNYSYAPGVILDVQSDFYSRVRFYDEEESLLQRDEIYYIPEQKFKIDVTYIKQCEEQWVGQAVVARNDEQRNFQLGAVRKCVGTGRQYMIEWANGQITQQNASCIFGAFTKRHSLALGDKVLAIASATDFIYLPGTVKAKNGDKVVVEFFNNTENSLIDPTQCFWLSNDYYNNAVNFCNSEIP